MLDFVRNSLHKVITTPALDSFAPVRIPKDLARRVNMVLGEPIWGNPQIYRRLGFCPAQDSFYERMTGLEWVTALVRLNGLDERAADEAARRIGLVELEAVQVLAPRTLRGAEVVLEQPDDGAER